MDRPELETRTKAFAVAAIALCESIRTHPNGWTAAKQLLDCSSSVGANYRATSRARSRAEWIAKMGTVVEEADESVYWLEVAQEARMGDRAAESSQEKINREIDSSPPQEINRCRASR